MRWRKVMRSDGAGGSEKRRYAANEVTVERPHSVNLAGCSRANPELDPDQRTYVGHDGRRLVRNRAIDQSPPKL